MPLTDKQRELAADAMRATARDDEIYASKEYRERIERNKSSLYALPACDQIRTAAESMAYWQLRAARAEKILADRASN